MTRLVMRHVLRAAAAVVTIGCDGGKSFYNPPIEMENETLSRK